jgi:hypothetical protein
VRRALVALVTGLLLMSGAGTASAITGEDTQGFTWFSDGGFMKQAPSGTVISAYANGARLNTAYRLVMSPSTHDGFFCEVGRQELNPNLRYPSSRGFIPNTAGVVSGPPGEYDVCFLSELLNGFYRLGTSPVLLTIV